MCSPNQFCAVGVPKTWHRLCTASVVRDADISQNVIFASFALRSLKKDFLPTVAMTAVISKQQRFSAFQTNLVLKNVLSVPPLHAQSR